MNKDLTIMLKVLLGICLLIFILVYPRTVLLILAFIYLRAMYIQRSDYSNFLRKIKYTFKLRF
jgi:hypothetical protein